RPTSSTDKAACRSDRHAAFCVLGAGHGTKSRNHLHIPRWNPYLVARGLPGASGKSIRTREPPYHLRGKNTVRPTPPLRNGRVRPNGSFFTRPRRGSAVGAALSLNPPWTTPHPPVGRRAPPRE